MLAKHYITINGRRYIPGEEIDCALTSEQIERFTRLGAIDAAPVTQPARVIKPAAVAPAVPEAVPEEARPQQEEEEAEYAVPTIDVMDGIVKPKGGKKRK